MQYIFEIRFKLSVEGNSAEYEYYCVRAPVLFRQDLETLRYGEERAWLRARYIEICKTRVEYDTFSEERKRYALRVIEAAVDIYGHMYTHKINTLTDLDQIYTELRATVTPKIENQKYAMRSILESSKIVSNRVLEALKDDPNFVTPPGPHGSIKTSINVRSFVDIDKNWDYYLGLIIKFITYYINRKYFGDRKLKVTARGDGYASDGIFKFNVRIS